MNKKGFTLVELIVSFSMITILSLIVFRTTINIQQKQLRNMAYSNILTFKSQVNEKIQYDLLNNIVEELSICGNNCFNIKYKGKDVKKLSIDLETKILTYGDFAEKLPKNFTFNKNMTLTEETALEKQENGIYDSMIIIKIPIESNVLTNKYDLYYVYQYNENSNPIRSTIE